MPIPAPPFPTLEVAAAFMRLPEGERGVLLAVRELIYLVAAEDEEIGAISESLKWGQPSYVPRKANTGTPLRLGIDKSGQAAIYAHCQTSVISDFQSSFPNEFVYEGNRAVVLSKERKPQANPLRLLIRSALRYKL